MNRETQMKLVAILRDAMNAQGITQSDIARHIGTSSGMVSQAFSCKGQIREERWRMCCEFCGVDFDHFMESHQSRAEQSRAEQCNANRACCIEVGIADERQRMLAFAERSPAQALRLGWAE